MDNTSDSGRRVSAGASDSAGPQSAGGSVRNVVNNGIGVVCLIAAACGGGVKGGGFEFPPLTHHGQLWLAALGVTLVVSEQIASRRWALPAAMADKWLKVSFAAVTVCAIAVIFLLLRGEVIADPAPLPVSVTCAASTDAPSVRSDTTYWVLEGYKFSSGNDALNADRNITEPCAVRRGGTATIYRLTHVWQGRDPGSLTKDGKLSVRETNYLLVPNTQVAVQGELSGTEVRNSAGDLLYFNVWAPIELPSNIKKANWNQTL